MCGTIACMTDEQIKIDFMRQGLKLSADEIWKLRSEIEVLRKDNSRLASTLQCLADEIGCQIESVTHGVEALRKDRERSSTSVSGRMEFRFTTPVDHYGLLIDGHVSFYGSKESMLDVAAEIADGKRGPVHPCQLVRMQITAIAAARAASEPQ